MVPRFELSLSDLPYLPLFDHPKEAPISQRSMRRPESPCDASISQRVLPLKVSAEAVRGKFGFFVNAIPAHEGLYYPDLPPFLAR